MPATMAANREQVTSENIMTLQVTLKEAECLQPDDDRKNRWVFRCKYNLYVAKLRAGQGDPKNNIKCLKALVPEAERYEKALIRDIWQCIGSEYLAVTEFEKAQEAFEKACEFKLINQRSRKIKKLSRDAIDVCPKDQKEMLQVTSRSLEKFQQALNEAECLQIEENKKKQTVVICKYNLYVAKLCASQEDPMAIIHQLEDLIEEAKEWDNSLVPDIWQHVGRGYLMVNEHEWGTEALQRAESMSPVRDTFEIIDKTVKNVRDRMVMTYDYLDRLLKESPQEAKKKAKRLMDYKQYSEKSEWEMNQEGNKEITITSSIWCDIGLIYSQLEEYRLARKCFEQAENVRKEEERGNEKEGACTSGACCCFEHEVQIASNIAATWVLQEDFQAAAGVYEKYFPTLKEVEINKKGNETQRENENIKEKKTKKKNIKDIKNKDLLLHIYLNLAFCYLRLGNPDKAHTKYSKAIDVAKELDDMLALRKSLEGLMASFLTMTKSPNTLEWFKLDLGIVDSDGHSVYKDKATKAQKEINKRRQEFIKERKQENDKAAASQRRVEKTVQDERKGDRESIKPIQEETTKGASTPEASKQRIGANDTLTTRRGEEKQTPQAVHDQIIHSKKSSRNTEESAGIGGRNDKTFIRNGEGQSASSDPDINIKADCKTKGSRRNGKIQSEERRKQHPMAN